MHGGLLRIFGVTFILQNHKMSYAIIITKNVHDKL